MTDDLVSKIVSIYFQRCRRRPSLSLTHSASAQTPPSPILMRLFPDTSLHFSPKLNGSAAAAVNYVSEGGEVGGWEVETTSRGAGRLATIMAKNCLNLCWVKQEIFVKKFSLPKNLGPKTKIFHISYSLGNKKNSHFGKVCVNEIACLYVFISFFKYPHVMLVEHVTNTTFTCV